MRQVMKKIQTYIFRGLLAITPLGLTAFVLYFMYKQIDQRIVLFIDKLTGFSFPGMGILLLIVLLLFLGWFASRTIGRQIIAMVDRISNKIPMIRTVYNLGKQLSSTLSLPSHQVFERAVLIEYLKPGMWAIGFVTGTVKDRTTGNTLLKVYIPLPPNPATGNLVLAREEQVRDPGWSVSEALKCVLSGGILGPATIDPSAPVAGEE